MFSLLLSLACAESTDNVAFAPASLPSCVLAAPDDTLDLAYGCADGVCVGMTLAEAEEAAGPAVCDESFLDNQQCEWISGVYAYFDDEDQDGVADADATASAVYVVEPFAGASMEGLGLGMSAACWVEALGDPEGITMEQNGAGGYDITDLEYEAPEVRVDVEDGFVEKLSLG